MVGLSPADPIFISLSRHTWERRQKKSIKVGVIEVNTGRMSCHLYQILR